MRGMVPERGDRQVAIPLTFDTKVKRDSLSLRKMGLGLLMVIGGLIGAILILIFAEPRLKIWSLFFLWGVTLFVRFIFLHELTFKKRQQELVDRDYTFSTQIFWSIVSINDYFPYICKLSDGRLIIFVMFDKDIIVGRDDGAEYDHYEAIADAYSLMLSRGISAIHIDYADFVGKDDRMASLFNNIKETENPELKQEMIRMYDYVQSYMYRSYADYDVYAFFYNGNEETFWEDLQGVLDCFNQANYVRNRVLTREDISDLCISLMNLEDFSVSRASERIFVNNQASNSYFKVIWTEKNGVRTQVNRTREEIENEQRVKFAEDVMQDNRRRKKKKWFGKKSNEVSNNDDLFAD